MRIRIAVGGSGEALTIWVVGFEDLMRMKQASGREQDLLDVHQLQARRGGAPD